MTSPLRFLTAGSVDDGKSTLIGRLLFDAQAILTDQAEALRGRATPGERRAAAGFDLSLLTDGLEAEREQGITIDVAFRYFATPRRKFVIADAPGHEQYTRNMVTAAAGSDAAVILVDLTKLRPSDGGGDPPLLAQTRRHALLAQLLRVPHLVFALNKIDAVDDPAACVAAAQRSIFAFARDAGFEPRAVLPISALRGDNVSSALRTEWYGGPSLLEVLESLPAVAELDDASESDAGLLPVQYVARDGADDAANPQRVLWGRLARGRLAAGDKVRVLPGGEAARVLTLQVAGRSLQAGEHVNAGHSVGVVLDRPVDASRGDWITVESAAPGVARRFRATLAWLDTERAVIGRKLWLRHGNRWVHARIGAIEHRLQIGTLEREPSEDLGVNDIGDVIVETTQPLPVVPFDENRTAGSAILVDPATHRTSGALLLREAA